MQLLRILYLVHNKSKRIISDCFKCMYGTLKFVLLTKVFLNVKRTLLYRQFTVLMKLCEYLMASLFIEIDQMTLV